MIALPSGRTTRVFTKQEFRIGGGGLVKQNKKDKKSKPYTSKLPPVAGGGPGGGSVTASHNLADHIDMTESIGKCDARVALNGRAMRSGSDQLKGTRKKAGRGGRGAAALISPGL